MPKEDVLSVLRFVFLATSAGMVIVSALFLTGLLASRATELDVTVLLAISVTGAIMTWCVFLRR
jgi:hypothetical protein